MLNGGYREQETNGSKPEPSVELVLGVSLKQLEKEVFIVVEFHVRLVKHYIVDIAVCEFQAKC